LTLLGDVVLGLQEIYDFGRFLLYSLILMDTIARASYVTPQAPCVDAARDEPESFEDVLSRLTSPSLYGENEQTDAWWALHDAERGRLAAPFAPPVLTAADIHCALPDNGTLPSCAMARGKCGRLLVP
jgi:hypothetical protein